MPECHREAPEARRLARAHAPAGAARTGCRLGVGPEVAFRVRQGHRSLPQSAEIFSVIKGTSDTILKYTPNREPDQWPPRRRNPPQL